MIKTILKKHIYLFIYLSLAFHIPCVCLGKHILNGCEHFKQVRFILHRPNKRAYHKNKIIMKKVSLFKSSDHHLGINDLNLRGKLVYRVERY